MTTDETILVEMLERATNPAKEEVDLMAIEMFCMLVRSNSSLITKAHALLVKKISGMDIVEANRAIGVLEECMSKGGEEFQKLTSKFKFLNELIGLVIDKHSGQPVPVETKKRIMECLLLWTIEHSDRKKFQEAYDNLKKQVKFEHGPKASNTNSSMPLFLSNEVKMQRSSIMGKDEELVAKLIKQGGEENCKKANLLIQHRYNQDAKRTEFICHLKSEMKKFENTVELLDQMLNSDSPGEDEGLVMQELYNMCKSHNEQMARWPDFLGDTPEFLENVLITKDSIVACMQRYKEKFDSQQTLEAASTKSTEILNNTKVTLPTTTKTATSTSSSTTVDILTELLGGDLNSPSSTSSTEIPQKDHTTFDDLADIFGNIETKSDQPKFLKDLLGNIDLLEPISVFDSETPAATREKTEDEKTPKSQGFKELREIDKLSEEIFKQSLQTEQRQTTFKKEPEKLTLNELVKDKIQTSLKSSNQSNGKSKPLSSSSSVYKSVDEEEVGDNKTETNDKVETPKSVDNMQEILPVKSKEPTKEENVVAASTDLSCLPVKPLAEINIELDELTPVQEDQRMLLDNEDIEVTLNFTADRPSRHVSVIVMTVTNKSRLPVKDFLFEASVKKPSKVRLLPPTDTAMAPRKPFRPSEPINQVILLMNPTGKSVDITCIVGYKLGDDPDQIREPIVAKDIPCV